MKTWLFVIVALLAVFAAGAVALSLGPDPAELAVNYCAVDEYCSEEGALTPEEDAACRQKITGEAVRIKAGIPKPCLVPIDQR